MSEKNSKFIPWLVNLGNGTPTITLHVLVYQDQVNVLERYHERLDYFWILCGYMGRWSQAPLPVEVLHLINNLVELGWTSHLPSLFFCLCSVEVCRWPCLLGKIKCLSSFTQLRGGFVCLRQTLGIVYCWCFCHMLRSWHKTLLSSFHVALLSCIDCVFACLSPAVSCAVYMVLEARQCLLAQARDFCFLHHERIEVQYFTGVCTGLCESTQDLMESLSCTCLLDLFFSVNWIASFILCQLSTFWLIFLICSTVSRAFFAPKMCVCLFVCWIID